MRDLEHPDRLANVIREHVLNVLKRHPSKRHAARVLGISLKTLYSWLQQWRRKGLLREFDHVSTSNPR